jgi:hypothetical protein
MAFKGGWQPTVTVPDQMVDKRFQPSLVENAIIGAAKAHRAVNYSHYEYRNYNRGEQMPRGRVK